MGNQQETDLFEFGWLSGVIDGEGCFGFDTQRAKGYEWFRPSFQLGNTDPRIIDRVVEIMRKHGISYHVCALRPCKPGQKPSQTIQVPGMKRVERLLQVIHPYLECKKDRAQVLLDYIALRRSKPYNAPIGDEEKVIVNHLRELNRRGISDSSETIRQTPRGEDIVRAA